MATSGDPATAERLLDLIPGIRNVLTRVSTSHDAHSSKPSGEVIVASLEGIGPDQTIVIGDTVWDAHAAQDSGAMFVGLLTGGASYSALIDAGAVAVHETPLSLAEHLESGHRLEDPPRGA